MGCLEAKMGLKVAEIRSAKFLYVIDFYLKTGKMRLQRTIHYNKD